MDQPGQHANSDQFSLSKCLFNASLKI